MGIYIISGEELEEGFENYLGEQEGDVPADAVAEAWNNIAKKEKWHDRLIACDKRSGISTALQRSGLYRFLQRLQFPKLVCH